MKAPRLRTAWGVAAALTVVSLAVQLFVLRPRQWPAGAGVVLSGGDLMVNLGEPSAIRVVHVPDLRARPSQPIVIDKVWPGGPADRAGLRPGLVVNAVEDGRGHRVDFATPPAADAEAALELWRQMYRLSAIGPITLHVADPADALSRPVHLPRPAVWTLGWDTFVEWLRAYHFGPLAKLFVYTSAALLVVALGAKNSSALLMSLAFLMMGATEAGPLNGADLALPIVGPLLLAFAWIQIAISFPVISTAVFHFPKRSPLLDRTRWIEPGLWLMAIPLTAIGTMTTIFLLDVDGVAPALAAVAVRPWLYFSVFAIGLAITGAVVVEGVGRYRTNPNATERRRIEVVVFTAVPGLIAYVINAALPIAAAVAVVTFRWPWPIALLLDGIILLSAVGLAYAVAVRRALSPRTVMRQGLQYALARKTLGLLTALPALLLVTSLLRQRDQPLSAIVSGRPAFYIGSLVLVALGLWFRDAWQRRLEQRFFRAEYDAKEILLSLANRVPSAADPRLLVQLVLTDIESALHPESAAVLVDSGHQFEPVHGIGKALTPLSSDSGLVQLLRWSDTPLPVAVNDERSPTARLPQGDRDWLRESGIALIVPMVTGSGADRPLAGFLALGAKRSEEPYSGEDRRLLGGIAGQMGLAADLWRLRQQVGTTPRAAGAMPSPTQTGVGPTVQSIDTGVVIDGKYRVDQLVGRGGMGAVYRARDLRLERDVAIKVVRPELVASPASHDRFRREAQMVARLQHPAIVTVFDYGTLAGGGAYLVMEYVRGEDLRSRMAREGALAPQTWAAMLSGVAGGVEAAHREGILHRDLKPENILLPENGGAKVLDFGVAKATRGPTGPDMTITLAGTVVGTPAYMAPEQLRGEGVDARADVYSLGVMAYEALTGHLPYGAGSFIDVAMKQADSATVVDTTALPSAVATAVLRAIAYQRDARPAGPVAFADELARAIQT